MTNTQKYVKLYNLSELQLHVLIQAILPNLRYSKRTGGELMPFEFTITDEAKNFLAGNTSDSIEPTLTEAGVRQSLDTILQNQQIYTAIEKLAAE